MPVPTNISFATAIDVGSSFPYSHSQQIDNLGTYYTVYYKLVATYTGVIGPFFYGSLTDYIAEVTVYESDETTEYLDLIGVDNIPIEMPITIGSTYYFKIVATGTKLLTPATLAVSFQVAPTDALVVGDLLIPDDNEGSFAFNAFPGVIVNGITGNVRTFALNYAPAEFGVALTNGYSGVISLVDNKFKIYDSSFALVHDIDVYPGQDLGLNGKVGSNKVDTFYVGNWDVPNAVQRIYYDGSLISPELTPLNVSGSTFRGLDVNDAGTILYYTFNAAVLRWDVTNNVALSNLVGAVASFAANEIKVLSDGTILVLYFNGVNIKILRYDTSGSVLNTYTFTVDVPGEEFRMDVATDNPNSFWVYYHLDSARKGTYTNIKVSDGSTISTIANVVSFESGTGIYNPTTASPTRRFGATSSCPLMVLRSTTSLSSSGLYVQTGTATFPATTNDELFQTDSTTVNVALPDPTAIIYPAGD